MNQNFPKTEKKNQGFTLVELLIVIAIIGLLATIVLVSFGPVRNQARDTAIKANMSQMRLAAEIAYITDQVYTNTNQGEDYLAALDAANSASPGTLVEVFDADAYCISTTLATNASNHWCIDSTGKMGELSAGCNTANACP
jgi:type IV pilus assembly protein PilA